MRLVEGPEANGVVPRARADSGRSWELRPEERWSQDRGPEYQGLGVFIFRGPSKHEVQFIKKCFVKN